jgi:hypothetical protein
VFSGAGRLDDLAWSPDGAWLLVSWPNADQWLFIGSAGIRRLRAYSGITRQFGMGSFPIVVGWTGK